MSVTARRAGNASRGPTPALDRSKRRFRRHRGRDQLRDLVRERRQLRTDTSQDSQEARVLYKGVGGLLDGDHSWLYLARHVVACTPVWQAEHTTKFR